MSNRLIKSPHTNFEQIKKANKSGIQFWEARELMPLLEYEKWSNFEKVIEKAKKACEKSNQNVENHFTDIGKMVFYGYNNKTKRIVKDYKLTRYACYLVAQNGDSQKKTIARAQTYFALQTRKQELSEQINSSEDRLFLRSEVKTQNKELNDSAAKAGVSNFARFHNAGYLGLYSMSKKKVQQKKKIGNDNILDRAGAVELAANLFRITQTDDKIKREKIKGEGSATFAHTVVGGKVRKSIKDIGGTLLEDLSPEEHIKLVEQKQKKNIHGEQKSLLE